MQESRSSASDGSTYYVTIHYNRDISHVNKEMKVWSPPNGMSIDYIPVGNYLFPFTLFLPPNSPGSFEGGMGSIRYYCKASIDRPEGTYHLTTKREFTVIPIVDLNLIRKTNLPYRITKTKKTGVLMYNDRQIEMTITMQKRGLVPGENLALDIDVANHTKKKIRNIEVTVVQMSKYVAYRQSTMEIVTFEPNKLSRQEEKGIVRSNKRVNNEGGSKDKVT